MLQIKLRPKQLTVLSQIQEQKKQLNGLFQELNNKEVMLLELVFEENNINTPVASVKLNGDNLEYELQDEKKEVVEEKKVKKLKYSV